MSVPTAVSNPSADRRDPLPVFCFKVELSLVGGAGNAAAFFKSVSGIKSEIEVVDWRQGGENNTARRLVGTTKWSNIVLKRGFTGSSELPRWHNDWMSGKSRPRLAGTLIQLAAALKPKAKWTFKRGWPCKWDVGDFDAAKSELAIETLEIAHEGLEFVTA